MDRICYCSFSTRVATFPLVKNISSNMHYTVPGVSGNVSININAETKIFVHILWDFLHVDSYENGSIDIWSSN